MLQQLINVEHWCCKHTQVVRTVLGKCQEEDFGEGFRQFCGKVGDQLQQCEECLATYHTEVKENLSDKILQALYDAECERLVVQLDCQLAYQKQIPLQIKLGVFEALCWRYWDQEVNEKLGQCLIAIRKSHSLDLERSGGLYRLLAHPYKEVRSVVAPLVNSQETVTTAEDLEDLLDALNFWVNFMQNEIFPENQSSNSNANIVNISRSARSVMVVSKESVLHALSVTLNTIHGEAMKHLVRNLYPNLQELILNFSLDPGPFVRITLDEYLKPYEYALLSMKWLLSNGGWNQNQGNSSYCASDVVQGLINSMYKVQNSRVHTMIVDVMQVLLYSYLSLKVKVEADSLKRLLYFLLHQMKQNKNFSDNVQRLGCCSAIKCLCQLLKNGEQIVKCGVHVFQIGLQDVLQQKGGIIVQMASPLMRAAKAYSQDFTTNLIRMDAAVLRSILLQNFSEVDVEEGVWIWGSLQQRLLCERAMVGGDSWVCCPLLWRDLSKIKDAAIQSVFVQALGALSMLNNVNNGNYTKLDKSVMVWKGTSYWGLQESPNTVLAKDFTKALVDEIRSCAITSLGSANKKTLYSDETATAAIIMCLLSSDQKISDLAMAILSSKVESKEKGVIISSYLSTHQQSHYNIIRTLNYYIQYLKVQGNDQQYLCLLNWLPKILLNIGDEESSQHIALQLWEVISHIFNETVRSNLKNFPSNDLVQVSLDVLCFAWATLEDPSEDLPFLPQLVRGENILSRGKQIQNSWIGAIESLMGVIPQEHQIRNQLQQNANFALQQNCINDDVKVKLGNLFPEQAPGNIGTQNFLSQLPSKSKADDEYVELMKDIQIEKEIVSDDKKAMEIDEPQKLSESEKQDELNEQLRNKVFQLLPKRSNIIPSQALYPKQISSLEVASTTVNEQSAKPSGEQARPSRKRLVDSSNKSSESTTVHAPEGFVISSSSDDDAAIPLISRVQKPGSGRESKSTLTTATAPTPTPSLAPPSLNKRKQDDVQLLGQQQKKKARTASSSSSNVSTEELFKLAEVAKSSSLQKQSKSSLPERGPAKPKIRPPLKPKQDNQPRPVMLLEADDIFERMFQQSETARQKNQKIAIKQAAQSIRLVNNRKFANVQTQRVNKARFSASKSVTMEKIRQEILEWEVMDIFNNKRPTQHNKNPVNKKGKKQLEGLPNQFDDAEHYCVSFKDLLLEELRAQIQSDLEEKIAGMVPENFECVKVFIGGSESHSHIEKVTLQLDEQPSRYLRKGDLIVLSKSYLKPQKIKLSPLIFILVEGIQQDKSGQGAGGRSVEGWIRGRSGIRDPEVNNLRQKIMVGLPFFVMHVTSLVSQFRELKALCQCHTLPERMLETLFCPPKRKPHGDNQNLQKFGLSDDLVSVFEKKYNEMQRTAISGCMSKEQFVLVQGPPGTGKTSAILGMIAVLLQKELSQQQIKLQESKEPLQHAHQPERRVLVCAQSNAAVDEIAERLAIAGVASYDGKMRAAGIVRCGKLDAMNEKITAHHIDNIAEQREKSNRAFTDQVCKNKKLKDDMERLRGQLSDVRNKIDIAEQIEGDGGTQQKELSGWRDQRRRLQLQLQKLRSELEQGGKHAETVQKETKQHVLRSAEIVLCTLSGSGGDLQQLMTQTMPKFDALIVDEAAQALEPSMLIPLRQLSQEGIVVLVGDPRQLPPTVKSRNAQYAKLSQSMFERFQKCQHQVVMLSEQYRMHPEISKFPSSFFYDNMLLDGMGISSQSKSAHYHSRLGPLIFIDHHISREQSGKTGSLQNQNEAQLALKLVQGLVEFCGADLYTHVGSIAIISPYKAQIRLLKQMLERKIKKDVQEIVDISTVDAYQGKEADVVIFSCVRAQVSSVGFLSDVRRMNVAFTRAKRSLWVIGHSQTLESNEAWSAFLKDVRARNLVIQADQLASQLLVRR